MATVNYLIDKNKKKEDGTWRVHVRVTHKRIKKYISTDIYVTKSQLNKNFEIKDDAIFDEVRGILNDYRKKLNKISTLIDEYTCQEVKEYLLKNENPRIDYIQFAKDLISKINVKGSKDNATTALNSFIDYVGAYKDINEIDLATIESFEEYLRSERKVTRSNNPGKTIALTLKPVGDTGIKDYMTKLHGFYKEAMRQFNDRGMVRVPYDPFEKYVMPKQLATRNRNLEIDAIKAIRDCPDVAIGKYKRVKRAALGRDLFMLSFYLIGMNAVDLYNATEYEKGRINYSRAKTSSRRKDNAFISVKVPKEAIPLIEKYRDDSGTRVFSFYKMYNDHDGFTKGLNSGLKTIVEHLGLSDDITFYYARYSWANIARNVCRISKDDVAMAINHSDSDHRTTDIYLAKDWKIIDDANRKVLDTIKDKKLSDYDLVHEAFPDILENLSEYVDQDE
jgi:integrase